MNRRGMASRRWLVPSCGTQASVPAPVQASNADPMATLNGPRSVAVGGCTAKFAKNCQKCSAAVPSTRLTR